MMRHSVHPARLRALLAAGAALIVLGAAPAAHAATVSEASGRLAYVAAKGEANHVTIAPWGFSLKVTDTGTKTGAPIVLTAGSGCWKLSSSSAACAVTPAVAVDLGDGDDFIDARDGKVDTITCGAGSDTGNADTGDSVAADCESVVKPTPAPTDPGTPVTDPVIAPPVTDPVAPVNPVPTPVVNSVPPTIPPQTVNVSASGVANVLVVCPPDSGGCSGVVTIELPGASSRVHAKVSAARAAKSVKIGAARFKAAAGSSKSVPVRLNKRGRQRILRGRRRTRARITVTTRSATGATTVTSQDVTIRPRPRAKRRKAPRR